MSEANKDLLEKYRKEVALRRKYHEQLVELKGMMGCRRGSSLVLKTIVIFMNQFIMCTSCFQATSVCCVV